MFGAVSTSLVSVLDSSDGGMNPAHFENETFVQWLITLNRSINANEGTRPLPLPSLHELAASDSRLLPTTHLNAEPLVEHQEVPSGVLVELLQRLRPANKTHTGKATTTQPLSTPTLFPHFSEFVTDVQHIVGILHFIPDAASGTYACTFSSANGKRIVSNLCSAKATFVRMQMRPPLA